MVFEERERVFNFTRDLQIFRLSHRRLYSKKKPISVVRCDYTRDLQFFRLRRTEIGGAARRFEWEKERERVRERERGFEGERETRV